MSALGGTYFLVVIFLLVLAILWFFLPFAIFGTKAKLDALIQEMRKMNTELVKLREQFSAKVEPTSPEKPRERKLTHDELMAKYKISNNGERYIFRGYPYKTLEDAVAYARKQTQSE